MQNTFIYRLLSASSRYLLFTALTHSTAQAEQHIQTNPAEQDVSNDASVLNLEEITVEGEAPATVADTSFQSRTAIKDVQGAANDGADLLKELPGFGMTRQGGMASDPMLRGLGGSRLTVLLDGTPFGGACNHRMDPATAYVKPNSLMPSRIMKWTGCYCTTPKTIALN